MNPIQAMRNLLRRGKNKVFCIGYNKTGTTSLEATFKQLGYRCPDQGTQESLVVEALFEGNFKPLKKLCTKYEAFQDMPFSQGETYAQVDCMFPGSKFILTVRDSNEWYESLTRFHLSGILKMAGVSKLSDVNEQTFKDKALYINNNYLYNVFKRHAALINDYKIDYDWSLVYDKAHRIKLYETRNQEIIKYFQYRPEQLLVLNLQKEKDTSKIIEFLELPKKLITKISWLNKSSE